jgi:hypothetical protein
MVTVYALALMRHEEQALDPVRADERALDERDRSKRE